MFAQIASRGPCEEADLEKCAVLEETRLQAVFHSGLSEALLKNPVRMQMCRVGLWSPVAQPLIGHSHLTVRVAPPLGHIWVVLTITVWNNLSLSYAPPSTPTRAPLRQCKVRASRGHS